jgi:excisionase family DNA binding protein
LTYVFIKVKIEGGDQMKNMTTKFLNTKEVAEVLRVSERSVFRYIHEGKLKASKVGYWRINEKDLEIFLQITSNVKIAKKQLKK